MRKLFKKSLACILTAIICVSLCVAAVPASAATPAYSTNAVEANAGETVTIDFAVSNFANVKGAMIKFFLPEVVASITGVTVNGEALPAYDAETGAGYYQIDNAAKSIKFLSLFGYAGELASVETLTFNVTAVIADDAAEGTYTYAAPEFQITEDGEELVTVTGTCGKFEVIAAGCEHDYEGVVTTRPTKDTTGVRTFTCALCGDAYTEVIPVATLKTEAADGDTYKIGKYLDLKSSIMIGYNLRTAFFANAKDYYGICTKPVYNEAGEVIDTNITTVEREDFIPNYNGNSARTGYNYAGVLAKEMGNVVVADFYAEQADGTYVYITDSYSLAIYANAQLGKNAKLNTTLIDMLNYGTAAQNYFKYNAANPVNEMFDSFATYANSASASMPAVSSDSTNDSGAAAGSNYKINMSRQLDLSSSICISAAIRGLDKKAYTGDLNALTAKCTYDGTTVELTAEDFVYDKATAMYYVNFNKFTASQYDKVVTIAIYEGETVVSNVFNYSVQSYYSTVSGLADTNTLRILTEEMLKYCASAKAYFGA